MLVHVFKYLSLVVPYSSRSKRIGVISFGSSANCSSYLLFSFSWVSSLTLSVPSPSFLPHGRGIPPLEQPPCMLGLRRAPADVVRTADCRRADHWVFFSSRKTSLSDLLSLIPTCEFSVVRLYSVSVRTAVHMKLEIIWEYGTSLW